MNEPSPITFGTRAKAFICRICPVCIVARRRPDSAFARKVAEMEKDCPFCRAYRRLRQHREER